MKACIITTSEVEYFPSHSHKCKKDNLLHHPIPAAMSNFSNEKLGENIPNDKVHDLTKNKYLQTIMKLQAPLLVSLPKREFKKGHGKGV